VTEPALLATLRELAATLARADVGVGDVVAALDGESTDHTGNVIVERPGVAGIDQASVVRAGGDVPAHVTLELSAAEDPGALERALGAPARVHPDHPGQPDELVYPATLGDGPAEVVVIATDGPDGVRSVTLRRDYS
jgi:hypothetical protein